MMACQCELFTLFEGCLRVVYKVVYTIKIYYLYI